MIVYVDIILIENFIVNLFLLLIAFKVLRYRYYKSIYLSAIIGSLYTLVLFYDNKVLVSIPFKIMVAILMIIISLKSINVLKTIKSVLSFIISSFILCGLTFSFSFLENYYSIFNSYSINNYSLKYLIIALMCFYIVSLRVADYIKDRAKVSNFIYDIEVSNEKKTIFIKGLLDTGNALTEPVTNLPCIIAEKDFLEEFSIKNSEEFTIPFKTIGEEGNLKGFKIKDVKIRGADMEWKIVDVVICRCKNKLSKENEFNALLSRGVI